MPKNLVIVESPAKAKTIESYLGKDKFVVASSYGHIRDLPKNNKAIDIDNGFEPTYIISKDKEQVVKNLTSLAKKSDHIYLASDDDREGESIAWHLSKALELDETLKNRIVFREITKKAISKALETPRSIDIDLVNSQQARRVLDRLVGFDLSPILWQKIKAGLSAGRVQSVAVRLVVEREREILNFKPKDFFKVKALFEVDKDVLLEAELNHKFDVEDEANKFLNQCIESLFKIENIETKPAKRSPSAPYTTSTLQQDASAKLGYSVSQTMILAQKLYEEGKISYMRTDSVNLSEEAIDNAKNEIEKTFGKDYSHPRRFKTKSSSAQEAHEAIRPTEFSKKNVTDDAQAQRLYQLIWKRSIASQMADAKLEKTNVTVDITQSEHKFIAKGEVVIFKGFLEVYQSANEEKETQGLLPPLKIGQELKPNLIEAKQRFTKASPRYTEASLVKVLEEEGIGRPSTYAPTISTIQKRGYVVKESREGTERQYILLSLKDNKIDKKVNKEIVGTEKSKLFPTDIGMIVNDFLVEHFPNITDYGFTARIEEKLDEIANQSRPWRNMIQEFYNSFRGQVNETSKIERQQIKSSRELGTDPKTGKPIIARVGRYGPLVQIGSSEDEEKPTFAPLRKNQLIETITLEEALDLFKLPRVVGTYEEKEMVANVGRFGPYIRHNNTFYSITKQSEKDPNTITEQEAIDLIEEKRKKDREKIIKDFNSDPEVMILNGRWGPYIKSGKLNVRIPKGLDAKNLTLEKCMELIDNHPKKK